MAAEAEAPVLMSRASLQAAPGRNRDEPDERHEALAVVDREKPRPCPQIAR